ncbi:MAG: alpha/beta hydrolase [Granulosicoccus sp.]
MHNITTTIAAYVSVLLLTMISLSGGAIADTGESLLEQFPTPQQDFQKHIEEVRDYLLDTQLESRTPADVNYNLPFEIRADQSVPYRGKYLLIHGLNDSPAVWHDGARALVERGYDVRAILLPGHGNTPETQLDVSYEQWLDVARAQLAYWRSPDTPLHIGGFSLGGVIATILALENDDIQGLFLFAPAYYSTKNSLLRWASLVSHFKPWVFGGMITEDNPTKYNSIPINAAAQYYKSAQYLQEIWGRRKLSMPVLMIATFDDSVVRVNSLRAIFQRHFSSKKRRLVLYGNDPHEVQPFEIMQTSHYPEYRILNQSHMSMMMAPDNALFGTDGTQLVCNGNEWPVYSACLFYEGQPPRWHGAEGTESPDDVPMARTTFNPDFAEVFKLHDEVFE